ncbi:sensor histidine kinase [Alteromonas sediminis]|uniref:Sensor histidine kinase n=1 Tax=Alteromonas sediminis TaxID=2259342 RepID=A0A3N5ZAF6_9ALTE|nr:sensor histidine kinase [Alteromonas sediminis]RPJ66428.1 sensor histidine kinase [Alteromonas sediminis]
MSSQSMWLKIHHKLLPQDSGQGYLPYVLLVYMWFLFIPFFFYAPPLSTWLITLIGAGCFLVIYFWTHWQHDVRRNLLSIMLICVIGSVVALENTGASVFFVYASAFAFKVGPPKTAMLVIGVIVSYVGGYAYLNSLSWYFTYPTMFFSTVIGGINIYQTEINRKNRLLKLSQEELSKVAAMAERERIARDLHDLIGHTLSMITMKTQLANKLIDKDIERAKKELKELETISRETLSDVRDAVTGFKNRDFTSELANAKVVFQNADIALNTDMRAQVPKGEVNKTLTLALREMVTNVMRHSNASECTINLFEEGDDIVLSFSDNGKVESLTMGNGLKGVQERAESCGGSLRLTFEHGYQLILRVPV